MYVLGSLVLSQGRISLVPQLSLFSPCFFPTMTTDQQARLIGHSRSRFHLIHIEAIALFIIYGFSKPSVFISYFIQVGIFVLLLVFGISELKKKMEPAI